MKILLSEYSTLLRRCSVLFFCYLFLGFLLKLYQVSTVVWIFTYLSIFYLSWSGTGAIALVLFFTFMIIGISFYQIDPGDWFQNFLSLNDSSWFQSLSRQLLSLHSKYFKPTIAVFLWIVMLLFIWLVGIGITFYHGLTQVFIENKIEERIIVFLLLSFLSLIGVQIGKLFVQ